jgi:anaerobic ribonucleoside-triphosphate reductase activating protein
MYIDRILSPIVTLGPGKRLVIWTKGCSKHCVGCANPELWSTDNSNNYMAEDIFKIINNIYQNEKFDGVTISGGDPLEQIDELLELLEKVNLITRDVLVYTGYSEKTLDILFGKQRIKRLKETIAVLIDEPYIEELNVPDAVLRGSLNQNIIFYKEEYRELYEKYINNGRKIQNVYMGNRLISVGIHDRKEDL